VSDNFAVAFHLPICSSSIALMIRFVERLLTFFVQSIQSKYIGFSSLTIANSISSMPAFVYCHLFSAINGAGLTMCGRGANP